MNRTATEGDEPASSSSRGVARHRDAAGSQPPMPALLGGRLCLDFANTVEYRQSDHPLDLLTGYADLVRWSRHAGIVDAPTRERLLAEAARRPAAAAATFAWAITLREAIYGLFAALAAGSKPNGTDLDTLNTALASALPHMRIVPDSGGFREEWETRDDALDCILWPVARSALDLLVSDAVHRVKDCARAGGCGWLFLDSTKNGSRRWCSMEVCGSRAKARRARQRKRT